MSEPLKVVVPIRLDKTTVLSVRRLCKNTGLSFSTMLRVLILEAIKARRKKGDL